MLFIDEVSGLAWPLPAGRAAGSVTSMALRSLIASCSPRRGDERSLMTSCAQLATELIGRRTSNQVTDPRNRSFSDTCSCYIRIYGERDGSSPGGGRQPRELL